MASTDNVVAITNAIKSLNLREHAVIADDAATLEKIANILKNPPTAEQIERLRNANVAFEAATADLSNPILRSSLNLLHIPVFPEEKMDELATELSIDTEAFVFNEFNPAIRKAMKLPFVGPRNIVSQYFARLRVSENKSYSADGADRTKSIEETSDSPLTPHHVNELLTVLTQPYICPADIPSFISCRYESRNNYFALIAAIIERGDAAQLGKLEHQLVSALVDLYYTGARPNVYELFSHMAANELMVIDGDSLILSAMSNANVDWDLMQTLHVAYLAHKFIMDFKNRGAKIHVIFFDCHDWFWTKSPQKRLIRNAVKQLLSARADQHDAPYAHFNFASYYGAKFKEYLEVHSPEFIVLNDGEEMTAAPVDEVSAENAAASKKVINYRSVLGCEEHGAKAAAALHRMMIHFVANRIHVVYSSRQVHKDNNIFGFTVRASSAFFVPFEPLCSILEAQARADVKAYADTEAVEEIGEDVKEALSGENAKNNGLIATVAAAKYLIENKLVSGEADLAVFKAAVIAVIVQPSLSVKARFQNIDSADPKAAEFVAVVSKLAGIMADMWADLDGVRSKDYDAFDGHFIAAISLLIAANPIKDLVDEEVCEQINEAWATVTGEESANITDAPITGAHFIAHKPAAKDGAFIFYNHELVNSLVSAFGVQPLPAGSKVAPISEDFITKAIAKFPKWIPNHDFVEYNAVISEKEEQEKKIREAERAATNRRFREALKRKEARYFHAIDEIARSMNVLESKVTTGKKITDASASGSSGTTAPTHGHSGQRNTNTISRAQEIQESNAVNLIIKSVTETMDRTASKIKQFERNSIRSYDPLTATPEATKDLMRVLKETVDYANSISIIRQSEEEVTDGMGKNPYAEVFRRAYQSRSEGRTPYAFICEKAKDVFVARQTMEKIAKDGCKKAEDLAALEKKFAKKKPSEADAKKMDELRASILVNEPNANRCGYFAARCFASMFQRYARFELLFTVLTIRANIWSAVKTKWFEETNVINKKEDKVAFLEQQTWSPAVELWLISHAIVDSLARESLPTPNLAQLDHVRAAIDNVGLETYRYQSFDVALKNHLSIDSLGAVTQKLRPTCTLPIDMDATTFQLRRMGERLQREVPRDPDPRVVFNADEWQRDLMDVVDSRGSVIVSAPTSSGKTFISYYCMEQVFSQTISSETPTSDIGVVVYVAPTRALINQAAADVYGRYKSKSYGNLPLKIFGVLGGRDFVRTPFDCQALITLPDVLETILLSPHNQKWLKRVKYFIFDEIHTMEDSGNGAVWERLLSLIRAPFVALSATIGDTNNLLTWLNRVQARQAAQAAQNSNASSADPRVYNVQLIPKAGTTIARWSDIEKHVFIPTTTKPLETLHRDLATKYVDRNDIVGFHPLSVTNFEMLNRKEAFPADCGIVPRETVELIEQMFTSFSPVYEGRFGEVPAIAAIVDRLRKLTPQAYMRNLLHITQTKARRWEADVKMELLTWVRMGTVEGLEKLNLDLGSIADDEEEIEALADEMKGVCESVLGAFSALALDREQQLIDKARNGEMAYPDTTAFIHSGIVRCLYTLIVRNLAPAIIFVLDQEECEQLVETVVSALEEAESNYRNTPAFRAFERKMAIDRERNEKLKSTQATMTHQKEEGDDNRNEGDRTVNSDNSEIRPDSDFIIPDILPEFTFAPMVALDDDLQNALEDNPNEKKTLLFRALQRGIGMHHNGISGKLRGSVERAFRKLQLPFVFSTEGLALGIHSPCRTVVLAGDNIALNVSEFRQMAGRAGRRGLDFLGHVVFFGISVKKIKRLMTGEMANLRGHSQIDPASALRLLQLFNTRADSKPGAVSMTEWHKQVANIAELAYVDPLFVRGRDESRSYCEDHVALLRHMMTYLVREGLVNHSPQAASSIGNLLVTMLNIRNNARLETSAFSLVSMITNQVLEKMAVSNYEDTASVEYTRQRLHGAALAISYIMTNHYKYHIPLEVHRSILRDPFAIYMRKHVSARSHTMFLPTPNAHIQGLLDLQTGRILKVLSHFVADRANFIELDPTLPLGLVNARGDIVTVVPTESADTVAKLDEKLSATANKNVKARHPLIAISGKTDNFESVEDITQSLAKGLFLDMSDVPAIDLVDLGRHDGAPTLINAAFYDYIRNGSQKRGEDFVRLHLLLYNYLSQSASWGTLNQMFVAVDSLNLAMKEIGDIANPTCTAISILTERTQQLRDELDNRPQWKRDARAGVAATLNV